MRSKRGSNLEARGGKFLQDATTPSLLTITGLSWKLFDGSLATAWQCHRQHGENEHRSSLTSARLFLLDGLQ